MTTFDRLIRIADHLGQAEHGSPEVDRAVHDALGQAGPVLAYTRNEAATRLLLPAKFEWMEHTYSAGMVYAACRRSGRDDDGLRYPYQGQWGSTLALAMCGAALRAHVSLAKG
jgi:hypothetical protein